MPVIMVSSLELMEYQKQNIAKKMTKVLSEETCVPEGNVYVFFDGYPLDGIAAGGVLNSDVNKSFIKNFITQDANRIKLSDCEHYIRNFRVKRGHEKYNKMALLTLTYHARAAKGCVGFDVFQSNINMMNRKLDSTTFIIKELWEGDEYRKQFEKGEDFQAFIALLNNQQESMLVYKRETTFDSCIDHQEDAIIVVYKVKGKSQHGDMIRNALVGISHKLRTCEGCIESDVYKGSGVQDEYLLEQRWRDEASLDRAGVYQGATKLDELQPYIENSQMTAFNMISTPVQPLTVNAIYGDTSLMSGLVRLNPEFGELCIKASAVPWGKPTIDQKTKVLIAIAVDVVEQITGKPFENHIHIAKKQGVTREEIEELLLFMTIYAGFNKAGIFYSELDRIYNSIVT